MDTANEGSRADPAQRDTRDGLISAFVAFFLWGVLPIYFVVVKEVGALEVLSHRVIWAVPFGALIIHLRSQWPDVPAR